MRQNQNTQKIIDLRNQGLSYGSVAKLIGLSRARIHQICSGYHSPSSNFEIKNLKENILYRDDFTCQWKEKCKGKRIKRNDLIIHHIDFNDKNNSTDNLITLCRYCHSGFHSNNHIDDKTETRMLNNFSKIGKIRIKYFKKKFEKRNKKIKVLRGKKMLFKEIGIKFGISDERARQICSKKKEKVIPLTLV